MQAANDGGQGEQEGERSAVLGSCVDLHPLSIMISLAQDKAESM